MSSAAISTGAKAPSKNKSERSGNGIKVGKVLLSILGVFVALVWAFPVYWMINSAMLPSVVLEKTTPTWFPIGGSLKNFASVFSRGTFVTALGISVTVAFVTVVVCLVFAFLAALAISRFRFRGRKSFVLAVLIELISAISVSTTSTPEISMMTKILVTGLLSIKRLSVIVSATLFR